MPNLFKVDFIQGKTDATDYNQVKHSLEDTTTNRSIISLSVSADKLQSVSNYSREPKRLVFECFPTTWIQDNILSGSNEHERYISHFEVKVYRDGALFFTGSRSPVTIRSNCYPYSQISPTITPLPLAIPRSGYWLTSCRISSLPSPSAYPIQTSLPCLP